MPELPEVETSRRHLERELVGRRIDRVQVARAQKLRGQTAAELQDRLEGQWLEAVGRRGKFLFLLLASGERLVIHRGMTGNFRLSRPDEPLEPHLHLLVALDDGRQLRLVDPRGFGEMRILTAEEFDRRFARLGREPLENDFTTEYLLRRFRSRTASIKALLLGQEIVAGLGNIYVDEVLWEAGLHPLRPAGGLSADEVDRLRDAIVHILPASIERGGVTFESALDLYGQPGTYGELLRAFQRAGQECSRCGETLESLRVAGRGTSYCPQCQPMVPG